VIAAHAQPDRDRDLVRMVCHTPASLAGVETIQLSSETHLFRAVPSRFSTVMHVAGHSEWTMRSEHWSTAPGTIGLKIPGEVYTERARRGHARLQVVVFDDALVDDARLALARPLELPRSRAIAGDEPRVASLVALHRLLLDHDASPAALEYALCTALAAFVGLTAAPTDERFAPSTWSTAVARARALLDARITESVPLDEIAAHARMDKYRLCRAFRDEVGVPPHAYVTHRRIGLAQELLARGMAQAEVAVRVGLYDQSQLHRHFKRIVGLTPGAYARAVR
jgi:AraC-like DNA-binding protein